ncbi:MAG TPA: alpha/beta hydrolase [Vulgatibacter sp.]|nr:alpha/beta hydrolase [Vulgatibacter sp.]
MSFTKSTTQEEPIAPDTREGFLETRDGTRLWYRIAGRGPALVCQNGVGVTITFWEDLAARFATKGYSTVLWDYRGHGRSDEPKDPSRFTLATCVEDLLFLMDELRIDQACLLGHSMGAQLGWEFYRSHRDRVKALVPTLGTYRNAISSFYDMPRVAPRVFDAARLMAETFPGAVKKLTAIPASQPRLADRVMRGLSIVHPTLSPKDWVPGYLQHMARLDPRVFFALARGIRDHDASDLLPRIEVPVLVVAGDRDFFCPPRVAREMADRIPGAELLMIPGGSHAAIIEQPALVDLRLQRFLSTRAFPEAAPTAAGRLALLPGGRPDAAAAIEAPSAPRPATGAGASGSDEP